MAEFKISVQSPTLGIRKLVIAKRTCIRSAYAAFYSKLSDKLEKSQNLLVKSNHSGK